MCNAVELQFAGFLLTWQTRFMEQIWKEQDGQDKIHIAGLHWNSNCLMSTDGVHLYKTSWHNMTMMLLEAKYVYDILFSIIIEKEEILNIDSTLGTNSRDKMIMIYFTCSINQESTVKNTLQSYAKCFLIVCDNLYKKEIHTIKSKAYN